MSTTEGRNKDNMDKNETTLPTENTNNQSNLTVTDSFTSSSISRHYRISSIEASDVPSRPFGITIIVALMILGTFTMLFWIFLLQSVTGIDEVRRTSLLVGLTLLGTIFLSLAVGLWLGINTFRYLFVTLGILLIMYALVSYLIDGTTSGLIFILPTSILIVYMFVPHVKTYFESTPTPPFFLLKKKSK